MADTQIINSQAVGVPSDYVLPGSVEFVLKAVSAEFDGSATLGSWLPAVEIYSDSGDLIARAVDPGSAVAAAGSAEASWFPGVKASSGGASSSNADGWPTQQTVGMFEYDINGAYFEHWANSATIDTGCFYNGFLPSDGTQNAFLAFRFNFGPKGSIHNWDAMYRKGPGYGILFGYLASIPESDPASLAADPVGVLKTIDTLTYKLAFKIDFWAAALSRNNKATVGVAAPATNPFAASDFRVIGNPGDPFTTIGVDAQLGIATIDGGPGPYALLLQMADKDGISTGYQGDLQALSAKRTDWSWE